jgi:hypothetical protein
VCTAIACGGSATIIGDAGDAGAGVAADGCAVGAEGCSCTIGGGCDPGLACSSGLCVRSPGGSADATLPGRDGATDGSASPDVSHANSDASLPDADGAASVGAPIWTGTFWGMNAGYTGSPIGDWMNLSYKGQCPPGMAVIGVSAQSTPGHAEDVACLPFPGLVQDVNCRALAFDPGNSPNPWGSSGVLTGDWDNPFYKAECNSNEYVAGVSQGSTSGALDGILCCLVAGGSTSNCNVQVYANQDSTGYAPPDWSAGYNKGQCPPGQVVMGVSAYASGSNTGAPHALLCCPVP